MFPVDLSDNEANVIKVLLQEALRTLAETPPSHQRTEVGRTLLQALDQVRSWQREVMLSVVAESH